MMRLSLMKDIMAERQRGRAALETLFAPRLAALAPSPVRAAKIAAAMRVQAGQDASLLDAEATLRGIKPAHLAAMILLRANAADEEFGRVEAERQAAQMDIDTATSAVEIDAILERVDHAVL